jgi:hypothetical protein
MLKEALPLKAGLPLFSRQGSEYSENFNRILTLGCYYDIRISGKEVRYLCGEVRSLFFWLSWR